MTPSDPPPTADIFNRVFVRANLTCRDDIEVPYYSSDSLAPVCSHCGCECHETIEGKSLCGMPYRWCGAIIEKETEVVYTSLLINYQK